MNRNGISTSETYRFLLADLGPFSLLFRAPIPEFGAKIGTSSIPEMEEDLEILVFKRAKVVNVQTNLFV
jgi:hypothetical protein